MYSPKTHTNALGVDIVVCKGALLFNQMTFYASSLSALSASF
ncbi:hypothetical protein PORCRE_123 [Porphyromonas crevioricanis JCM 15906]|uniref:Uncharacterized protein n=1 Tax=Porphyromonas crevioricanis JCM 15906 TaxID=1305617 RepID=S4PG34_9PORP|nr:hypothetical protein PORCRE_123 [Porphyromonas crevioricanis JCM 15906]GAD07024.1 hypothetical protein PORCAN_637 [Porphyromonas crevioricanis JCM 13913]